MSVIVNIDEKGRMAIPKEIREKIGATQGGRIKITADKDKAMIEPLKPVAYAHYGAFNIARWPEDLDRYASKALKQWWIEEPT